MREKPKSRKERPRDFFSKDEERSIVEAIKKAERRTSGEIRVHLEHHCKGDAYERGRKAFEELGMTQTELRNGVLIYLATGDHDFAVLGDSGIHEKVPENYWADVVALMSENFKQGAFVAGMTLAIAQIGEKLSEFFPYAGDEVDRNELDDELSFEDDESPLS